MKNNKVKLMTIVAVAFLNMVVTPILNAAFLKLKCDNGYPDAYCIYDTDSKGNVFLMAGRGCDGKPWKCGIRPAPVPANPGYQVTDTQTDQDGVIWTTKIYFSEQNIPYQVDVTSSTGVSKINFVGIVE